MLFANVIIILALHALRNMSSRGMKVVILILLTDGAALPM